MKRVIVIWLGLAGVLLAGGITFPETTKEVKAGLEDTSAKLDFPFTNKGDKPVVIKEAKGACSCVIVAIAREKTVYAPGESGVIHATFDFGDVTGAVEKDVLIYLEGDPEAAPSYHLTLKVNIPLVIAVEPKTVKWDTAEAAETKTIQITMMGKKPIHISSVSTGSKDFTYDLKTIEDGKSYALAIKPKATDGQHLAVFRLETDSESKLHRVQQAFALVKKAGH